MKKLVLTLLIISVFFSELSAKKKKTKDAIKFVSGVYSTNDSSIRKVGDVYVLMVKTLAENVVFDSVWFGATPVPCDLLDAKTNHKIGSSGLKGTYIVRANKNLYANFHTDIDSTTAYKNFNAPFPFKGDAVIMYKVNGVRYYKVVSKVMKVTAKGMRK